MSEVAVGDTIRHEAVPPGVMDVEVLAIVSCEEGDHPAYEITDPESGKPDTVCSREFVKI